MVKVTPTLTSSLSETMTTRRMYHKQQRQGTKRHQSLSNKSGSGDSGTDPKDVVERKSTSQPISPNVSVEVLGDHISRTYPEGGNLMSFFHIVIFCLLKRLFENRNLYQSFQKKL